MSQYAKFLEELNALQGETESLAKSLPADGDDDNNIAAAAGDDDADDEGQTNPDAGNGAAGENEPADGDADDGKEQMGKSFSFTLENGEVIEAMDGTELVKSLMTRIDASETDTKAAIDGLFGLVKSQADLIKSMHADMRKLASSGKGRKAVLSIAEKPAPVADQMAKSMQPEGMSTQEFFSKALALQGQGKLSGDVIRRAESFVNRGIAIPADVVALVADK